MVEELFEEDVFYKDDGYPTEELLYCRIWIDRDSKSEWGRDYDQFALVKNAVYPYIRVSPKIGNSQYPSGGCSTIATDGFFAKMTDEERNTICPKIAWGFAAHFLSNLSYNKSQDDYILNGDLNLIIRSYYDKYLNIFMANHNGLRYADIKKEEKELSFLEEHIPLMRTFWEKSTPLKQYEVLYGYTEKAVSEYERFLQQKVHSLKTVLMTNDKFSTEIRTTFNTHYVKVFFLDDSVVEDAKRAVETVQSVMNVNITESNSKSHPGKTLTVYPKQMVTPERCEKDITVVLNSFFTGRPLQKRSVENTAHFKNLENEVVTLIDSARVSIHVAMAWLTNQRIADRLIVKYNEGLDVKIVLFKDHTNQVHGARFADIPVKMIRGTRGGTMHDKFCVIDNQIVITGSYNWSENAEKRNDENALISRDDARASDYSVEFRRLFNSK